MKINLYIKKVSFFLFFLVFFSDISNAKARSDTFLFQKKILYFYNSKIKGINFNTCNESIIIDYINTHEIKNKYDYADEFKKRQIIRDIRDTLNHYQNIFSFDDIYKFVSVRLFGDYDFDKQQFPILGCLKFSTFDPSQLEYSRYKDNPNIILEHSDQGLDLVNADKFPLYLRFNEKEAQQILSIKKEWNKAYLQSLNERERNFIQGRQKFKDECGNVYKLNVDRRVYFIYYVRFVKPGEKKKRKGKLGTFIRSLADPSGVAFIEKDPNALQAEIVRLDADLIEVQPGKYGYGLYQYFPDKQIKVIDEN
jgi:hypothetical protein